MFCQMFAGITPKTIKRDMIDSDRLNVYLLIRHLSMLFNPENRKFVEKMTFSGLKRDAGFKAVYSFIEDSSLPNVAVSF